jgi:hypothetical protein
MTSSTNKEGNCQPRTFVVSSSILGSWLSGVFPKVASAQALVFEAGVELREIPSFFFAWFLSRQSICIQASVQVIRKRAFVHQFKGLAWFKL